jgi:D-sedoheptulose 7-phosphate isomerase
VTANHDYVRRRILDSIAVKQRVADECGEAIVAAAKLVADGLKSGAKLLLCGNGGSAADCQHMATELVGVLTKELKRPGLPAIALTTDTSFLTAYSNDFGFEGVFERQVQALGAPGDVLIGISTSGNSRNVLLAAEAARRAGMSVIALTGSGGALGGLADVAIRVPSSNTQYIQESHLTIEHIICELIEQELARSPERMEASSQ